jgi:hypothetical protein
LGSDGELGYILSTVSVFLSLGSDGELGYILSTIAISYVQISLNF